MSPEAIDQRLRELGQLYELGIEIRSARWLGTLEDLQRTSVNERVEIDDRPAGPGCKP